MSGRVFAYFGVLVGLSISVAANVMHARVDPDAPWWAPYLAATWPLLLFLALEVLTRTQWAAGRGVRVARAGVAVVASVAAALSYWHLHGLLLTAGEDGWAAMLGPLAIDGLMAVSAAALLNDATAAVAAEAAPVAEPGRIDVPASAVAATVPALAAPGAEVAPVAEPVAVEVLEVATVEAAAVEAAPVASEPAPRRTRVKPAGKAAAPRASDDDLLTRIDGLVQAGKLTPAGVTKSSVRARCGVGDDRARRLADAWHLRHRRTSVVAVAGD